MNAIRLLLAGALVAGALFATPGRAVASESEIPGEALTARSVSATVGGAVVDRVYRIIVPAGSVLIASLSGAAGAELGLYLFDQDATSILLDPPLATSAKLGGTQGITATLETPGEYYLDVNGRNVDRAYSFTLTYAITRDTSPAAITEVIAPLRAKSSSVCMTIRAVDSLSGVRSVLMTDVQDPVGASWQPYTGRRSYCTAVTAGNGTRTFSIRVKNGVGLFSAVVTRSVTIDDAAPLLRAVEPVQGSLLFAARPSVSWKFSERVRLSAGATGSVYAFSQNTGSIRGVAELSANGRIVTWRPSAAIPLGSVALVSLTGVEDAAGNAAPPLDTLEFTRKRAVRIIASLMSNKGDFVRVGYRVPVVLIGGEIVLQARLVSGWTELNRGTIAATAGSIRAAVGQATAVRLVWEGGDTTAPARSMSVSLAR